MAKLLSQIKSPKDLKKLSLSQLDDLAVEIRSFLLQTLAQNGGHLAPNLGTVELTLALHYFYNSPKDKMIWDVGHQAYTHKIITGRLNDFATLRKMGGLSGYLKITESKHDSFGAGHAGTSISASLGFAEARDRLKKNHQVVAIIGDGSLNCGLAYEGLNNIGSLNSNITVILNDNKWSISKNVGGMAKYLEKLSGIDVAKKKNADIESIFESLGFKYFGPINGHNIEELVNAFQKASITPGPKLIHVITKKGAGYSHSENMPDKYHSVNPFILESGESIKRTNSLTFTNAFADALIRIATTNKKVIAITAAMPAGTGVDKFAEKFPDHFYDTGIAEEHAVIFAAALALEGFIPVVAIYSTFLQRAYDQIIHDVALQKIPVIFAIDRAGIVGADGPTHHGIFDLSYLRHIPNLVVLAPKNENELQHMLYSATMYKEGPIAIRYPRGSGAGQVLSSELSMIAIGKAEKMTNGSDVAILAIGSMVYPSLEAAEMLRSENIHATVYNARSAKPIDPKMIQEALKIGTIITAEENILEGGFGSAVLEELEKSGHLSNISVRRLGIEKFIEHGEVGELKEKYGLTSNRIYLEARDLISSRNQTSVFSA